MSDRELLELAAKACGDTNIKPGSPDFTRWIGRNEDIGCDVVTLWNPILNDGDALRLAVKLGIEIHPDREVSEVVTAFCVHRQNFIGLNTNEEFGNDEMAATRRAIVRAAAEIGRQMKEGGAA